MVPPDLQNILHIFLSGLSKCLLGEMVLQFFQLHLRGVVGRT